MAHSRKRETDTAAGLFLKGAVWRRLHGRRIARGATVELRDGDVVSLPEVALQVVFPPDGTEAVVTNLEFASTASPERVPTSTTTTSRRSRASTTRPAGGRATALRWRCCGAWSCPGSTESEPVSRASALREQRRYRRLTVRLDVSWRVENDGRCPLVGDFSIFV